MEVLSPTSARPAAQDDCGENALEVSLDHPRHLLGGLDPSMDRSGPRDSVLRIGSRAVQRSWWKTAGSAPFERCRAVWKVPDESLVPRPETNSVVELVLAVHTALPIDSSAAHGSAEKLFSVLLL